MQRYFSNATNYFNDETTRPATGSSRRRLPKWTATSAPPQSTDIIRPARLVRFVPTTEVILAFATKRIGDF